MPRRNVQLPVDELVARYEAGESTCALARAYGVGSGSVLLRLRRAGVVIRYRGRKSLPMDEMAERYCAGESTTEVACAYGICRATAWKRLVQFGVEMRPEGAWVPGGPLWSERDGRLRTYDRAHKKCFVHRARWEAHYGPIPKEYVVHHANGDPTDNGIENLMCMASGDHSRLHRLKEATDDEA